MKNKLLMMLLGGASLFTGVLNAQNTLLDKVMYADDQLEIRNHWDNFKERDASIYNFKFTVPDRYVAGVKYSRDSKFFSSASSKINLSYFSKYSIFEITEEILATHTGKKIIVVDPDSGPKVMGATMGTYPGIGIADNEIVFENFPFLSKKKMLDYDETVGYIVEMDVKITENLIKPVCSIAMTVYNRDKKKVAKLKYKKKFRKISKTQKTSLVLDRMTQNVWKEDTFSGVPIPTIIDIYVQTLDEMLKENALNF